MRSPLMLNAYLAYLDVYCEQGDFVEAYHLCDLVLQQLKLTRREAWIPRRMTSDERKYVALQCKLMLVRTSRFVDSQAWRLASEVEAVFSDIDLSRVGGRTRRLLPLSRDYAVATEEHIRQSLALT